MEQYLERSLKNVIVSTYQGQPCVNVKYATLESKFVELHITLKPDSKFEATGTLFSREQVDEEGYSQFKKRMFSAVRATNGEIMCPLLPPQP